MERVTLFCVLKSLCLLEVSRRGESMLHVTAVLVAGREGCPRRSQRRSVPSSPSSSTCGAQCLPFLLTAACLHRSLLMVSATAFSAPLPPAFFTSIGLSLKLHFRNQNSYFYPLQTCLLHKLEQYKNHSARYFFFFIPV